jgi:transposase
MVVKFVPIDRETPYIFPPSVQDYLPKDHLARFVVDIVDRLDLSHLSAAYSGKGSKPYHPAMLVAVLFYGYSTGVFSSRKLEKACYDSIAFRYISANANPDHDTIASFRKRFLKELESLFIEILLVAEAMGLLKLGSVSLDGTKIKANASKHKALSWAHANQIEEQLKGEVQELMRLAEEADQNALPEEMDIPQELQRRETRLAAIEQAKQEIQRRAQERFEREQVEYEAKQAKRKAYEEATGKKARGKKPAPPESEPRPKDQVNLTDGESRIMPASSGGFEQAYNAQAGVDVETHLIVEQHVTQHTNDKQEIEPALENIGLLPVPLGEVENLLADTGYFSEANVERCMSTGIKPLISEKREKHNPPLLDRFKKDPEPPENPDSMQTMRHRMHTREGKALYAKRKSTVETVFGIIKQVLGFRQFLLRGLESTQGEWTLVCIGWNLKRMHALNG